MAENDMKKVILEKLKNYSEIDPAKIGEITSLVIGDKFAREVENQHFYTRQVFTWLSELKAEGKVNSVNCVPTKDIDILIKTCQWFLM